MPGPATLASAHYLLLWGIAVVAPLALQSTRLPHRHGQPFRLFQGLSKTLPVTATLMALGWLWQGPWLVAGAAAWLATTFALAMWGLVRLGGRPHFCPAEATMDLGLIYAPVGGIWTFAYAWQHGLMGFDPTMTLLTGVHFCYVTLGAMQWAGLAGRQLRHHRLYRALAGFLWVSPVLVAVGITYTHWLGHVSLVEGVAVSAQVLATAGISLLWLVRGQRRVWVMLSALASLVTMALALNYAWGRIVNAPHLDLAWMIPYHGWVNALGFVTLGLLGWRAHLPVAQENERGIPFSRVGGGWPIGPQYFERTMAIGEPPAGLLDSLEELSSPRFQADRVAQEVHDFYSHTANYALEVIAEWPPAWLPVARLYGLLSRRMGQMNFPVSHEEAPVTSKMLGLPGGMRGWVRSYVDSGQAIYAAAYTTHRHRQAGLMNIAFPLPLGNVTSLLWARNDYADGLVLSSLPSPGDDQGVFWAVAGWGWRLPINEEIEVFRAESAPLDYQSPCRPAPLLARHRSWVFGIPCLTLHYAIRPTNETSSPPPTASPDRR